jgi:sugar diacid utilization regulator
MQLEQEKREKDNLKKLQEQVEENQAMLRERLLFKLVVGAISPTEAIERGQNLGIDLIARCYLIVILKIVLGDRTEQYDYDEYQQIQSAVIEVAEKNPDVFVLKRDWGDLILMMKGNTPEYLEEERDFLLEEIKQSLAETRYKASIGVGASKNRIVIFTNRSWKLW